jgi:voltage-gated potassium channel
MALFLHFIKSADKRHRKPIQARIWRPWRLPSERPWRLPLWLLVIACAHVGLMRWLENMGWMDAIWLTATTIVTVGYGDVSAKSVAGRLATMILLYGGAIFVVAAAVNHWTDAKADKIEQKRQGRWRWQLSKHVLIIGTPTHNATIFFARLAGQIRAARGWHGAPIQALTTAFDNQNGLPLALRDLGVVHFSGDGSNDADFRAVNAAAARGALLLADDDDHPRSDGLTFDRIDRLRQIGYEGPIIAECVDDANRPRLLRAGATSLLRPMRGFPEALTRALFAPGAETVIENLFTAEGDECLYLELPQIWQAPWIDIACAIMRADIGTAIAMRDKNGAVIANPPAHTTAEATGLYVIVHDRNEGHAERKLADLLAELLPGADKSGDMQTEKAPSV